jgi:hypothetical protein
MLHAKNDARVAAAQRVRARKFLTRDEFRPSISSASGFSRLEGVDIFFTLMSFFS